MLSTRRSSLVKPLPFVLALVVSAVLALVAGPSWAAPEAHILRIDPRASTTDGQPILTTVVEVVQNKRMSDATRACTALSGDANLDCVANALEQSGALYASFDFPDKNAVFTITVDNTDMPAKFESKSRWADAPNQQPGTGVGTAWLILVDAASTMGPRLEEAKTVATAFVNSMGPNDIVDVMFFNDRGVVQDSKWVNAKQAATATIASVAHTYPTQGRSRALFNIIKQAATDGFGDLGNAGGTVQVPLHQALVVLSNGYAGTDTSTNAATAAVLKDYLTKGRFPEDNTVKPRMPVPVISIWFPSKALEEGVSMAREFMEGLVNSEIGGFYSIVREGAVSRAPNIVNAVRTRFGKMHIVKWRVSCVAPSITQTFKLVFVNTTPSIQGDTWSNVPVGIDPTTWPLDIDVDATVKHAKENPIYPGGTVKIYGNFCWGGSTQRAEIYMLPKNQAAPASIGGGTLDDAKKAQKTLIEQGMHGKAINAGDNIVEFELPNSDKWLGGKGDQMTARMIVYDNQAHRTSAVTADKILTLRAKEAPLPFLLIGGCTFGGVVLVLLVISIVRGGGGGRRRGGAPAPPPRPIVAGAAPIPAPAAFAPPPMMADPYAATGGGAPPTMNASRATLSGNAGIFTIVPGNEMRAGRDGAVCQILLTEPRVSGTHAALKLENGQLFVRDENSNNGTFLNGSRIAAGTWTVVPSGAMLRFGPVEFNVRLE